MTVLSKLQIRAKILEIISKINDLAKDGKSYFDTFNEELSSIEDKNLIADIILKEIPRLNENEFIFCVHVLKTTVNTDYLVKKISQYLKNYAISDELKYRYLELITALDLREKIKEIPNYFNNPDNIVDLETKKLLERATFNPEAMLDFLDFISNVSDKDAYLLLASLKEDFSGDYLANIIYPILYSKFNDGIKSEVIGILSESKSSLAIKPFNYLIKVSNNPKIINECKIGLNKLKLAGAAEEKANEYYNAIIKDYKPMEFYATLPDGSDNQALLITRVNKDEKCLLLAVVINDRLGINDCFGFYNISKNEALKVITKFYKFEGEYKVPSQYVKTRINEAVKTTINNKLPFPYEFICWNSMLNDIIPYDISIEEYINKYCKTIQITKEDALSLFTQKYTLRWFITPEENECIKHHTQKIYNQDNPNAKEISISLKNDLNIIFDTKTEEIWKLKLHNLIYLLKENGKEEEADKFYTIVKTKELYELFKEILIQRSIFSYFVKIRENIKEIKFTTNIFKQKNSNESKYNINKINKLIEVLRKHWING